MQIGIDLGATKIEYVVLDNNNSEIVRQRESTPNNYKKLLEVISSIIKHILFFLHTSLIVLINSLFG